jgi:hypothetical protein
VATKKTRWPAGWDQLALPRAGPIWGRAVRRCRLDERAGKAGRRVVRAVYEICSFQALRERLRCKEIWVVGADRWRNPDEDLTHDFEAHRAAASTSA